MLELYRIATLSDKLSFDSELRITSTDEGYLVRYREAVATSSPGLPKATLGIEFQTRLNPDGLRPPHASIPNVAAKSGNVGLEGTTASRYEI